MMTSQETSKEGRNGERFPFFRTRRGTIGLLAMLALATCLSAVSEHFIPCEGLVVAGSEMPSDAESAAVGSFVRGVHRITNVVLPQTWGDVPNGLLEAIFVGNAATAKDQLESAGLWAPDTPDSDTRGQSYALSTVDGGIVAAGFGEGKTPRSFLGMGYALGDLLRRLDRREGTWGFVLPDKAIIEMPAMPNRTLYLMNSNHMNPGLSLEYFTHAELEAYIDFLIDARYSRISFWQWTANMIYPDNFEENRARNQMTHRAMGHLFAYARRRGLEVYHQLTPMHANVDLLPDDPKFAATGYYGRNSICWAQPEGRELARKMLRLEMEYYGAVDGYIVWFYDPGGCFCDACKPNQARHLHEQFSMVRELAGTISPEAQFQAVLWPTWCFHEYTTRGIPYETAEEVQTFVKDFLNRVSADFGPRELTIMDTGELESSNIYNGLVDPETFKRSAFLYSIMGLPSESMYPFASFKINEMAAVLGKARNRGIEDANFFIQYANVNKPSVFAFGDILYDAEATADGVLRRYTATLAAGEARELLHRVLERLEVMQAADSYEAKGEALDEAERAWSELREHPEFLGSPEWLAGFLIAQRYYLAMARAETEDAFQQRLESLKQALGAIPMWKHFESHALGAELAASHIATYWRGPLRDPNIVGLPQ